MSGSRTIDSHITDETQYDRQTNRWTDRQTDGQTDGQTNTDRQARNEIMVF